eukprot:6749965-Prymnesium_polylepis.1
MSAWQPIPAQVGSHTLDRDQIDLDRPPDFRSGFPGSRPDKSQISSRSDQRECMTCIPGTGQKRLSLISDFGPRSGG